jgi:hypothetical protein
VTVAGLQEIQVSADADRSRGLEPEPIELVASDAVRDTLGALGRTEDVRLAPGGKRLVIACYALDRIAVADVVLAGLRAQVDAIEHSLTWRLTEPARGVYRSVRRLASR